MENGKTRTISKPHHNSRLSTVSALLTKAEQRKKLYFLLLLSAYLSITARQFYKLFDW